MAVADLPPFGKVHLALSHEAAKTVYTDARFSRRESFAGAAARLNGNMSAWGTEGVEGAAHRLIRRQVSAVLTTSAVARVEAAVTDLAHGLVEELSRAGQPGDLVSGLAVPLAVQVAAMVYGVTLPDPAQLRTWIDVLVSVEDVPDDQVQAAVAGISGAALRAVLRARPDPDASGLVPRLLATLGTDRPARTRIAHLLVMLVVAAVENPATSLCTTAVALLSDPALVHRVLAEPDRLGPVLDELLRLYPPGLMGFARTTTAEVELCGTVIPAGATVVPLIATANRDTTVFEAPDELRPGRVRVQPDLTFGWGAHSCVGAQLGRMQLHAAIGALLSLPGLRLAVPVHELPVRGGHIVDGFEEIPLRWERTPDVG
ncbi:cytochrome P450 [Amycolatopsis sp. WQ 127309]|uniref:cytochrome P450 n=1 Tax=Amycolatopsis sp. WQ 127309 TaxID=2932773 RepID=UPI001FF5E971|nr:cytochrome P450 [Amycolatopsis sp. WQ 127309]UOZ07006.1 cytochrome P450 [Amycolatopsis sp. WQ 127309]